MTTIHRPALLCAALGLLWLAAPARAADAPAGHEHGNPAAATAGDPAAASAAEEPAEAENDAFVEAPADVAFIGRLLLIDGHLLVGRKLYESGNYADALPHFHHPIEELYPLLEPELKKRNVPAFRDSLAALARAVQDKRPAADIAPLLDKVAQTVAKAEAQPGRKVLASPAFIAAVTSGLVQQAAKEYREAFSGDRIVNVAEYQDGYGFVRTAKSYAEGRAAVLKAKNPKAQADLAKAIDELLPNWAAPEVPKTPARTRAEVQAVVDRVELLQPSFR